MIRVHSSDSDVNSLSINKFTFFRTIQRHLMGNITSVFVSQDCHIYPHHFPVSLLEWRRNNPTTYLTTPLSQKVASEISLKELSYISLSDATNYVFHLHNHPLAKVDSSQKVIGNSHLKWFV